MNMGDAIRGERVRLGFSQSELGAQIGTSRQAVAALEQGRGRLAAFIAVEPLLRLHVRGLTHGGGIFERLRATRERDGRSLRNVAAAAAVSVNTLREVEAGRGSVQSMLRILGALAPHATFVGGASRSQKKGFVTVGRRISERHNPSDYFATPAPVTRLLLDREQFCVEHPILEPAVGEARAIDRVLRERGHQTVCFDLHGKGGEKQDFLAQTSRFHSLVTNPPFSLHLEFVLKAKEIIDHKIALLMPINYLIGAQRHTEIWEDRDFPLARVHVLNRGVHFSSDPYADTFRPSQLYLAWFVFERGHIGSPEITWIDCSPWIERKSRPVKVSA